MLKDEPFRKIFSQRLRHYMTMYNMNQSFLSKESGVSQTCISRYLSESRTPTGLHMTKLAKALGCSVEDLSR